ncbi:PH domain-containing protein [Virgibacillus sp. NKC19-3]|uniref:PH domain-containing protein n=1 Tax=Virgibacillus saliphilus TaxID=2831674 RepID=UPI001C9AFFA7|nr:PH domain-containing protein [Virgibacillus sp. NKC19-3]MBY7141904.1 PH domain-containing protein [Virgibacillus sp. NKC19-3]
MILNIVGYRLLSSRKAVEISYKKAFLGSIIISPQNRDLFIKELKKRCEHL